jgi:flavodoxin
VLIIYWSATGNTEKVAAAIGETLIREGIKPVIKKVGEAKEEGARIQGSTKLYLLGNIASNSLSTLALT